MCDRDRWFLTLFIVREALIKKTPFVYTAIKHGANGLANTNHGIYPQDIHRMHNSYQLQMSQNLTILYQYK